ncbi:cytochrome P450 [Colletotrichum zoysiae]|uniref:Cytochrome P450 n=1 Tax=Colletotrichum zoysiae TaxID=1216348 RepID=A0AAD9LWD3_9PEZI|nr:cytochrome P450 [Colletotrichum zoysiae]
MFSSIVKSLMAVITNILPKCIILLFVYYISLAVFNVTYHPLADIPGYKIAGMTRLYETFWCYHNGRSIYYRKVSEMHARFGPIIRISPNEISLRDPNDCHKIYSIRSEYRKDPVFYRTMGIKHGMFGAVDTAHHKKLRAPWQSFFSKSSISGLNDMILTKIEKLCQVVESHLQTTHTVPIQEMFHSLSAEITSTEAIDSCLQISKPRKAESQKPIGKAMVDRYLLDEAKGSGILTREAIIDEMQSFNVAGAFNTGTISSITLFHILSNERVRRRLVCELKAVPQALIRYSTLQKLPYFVSMSKRQHKIPY